MSEKGDRQDKMIALLAEILKWIKVTSIPQVKKLLLDMLPSDDEKIAYHYSDGRGSRAVAKFVSVNYSTVAKWWKTWVRGGIAKTMSVRRGERAKRIFSLEDFGIEIPSPVTARTERENIHAIIEEGSVLEQTLGRKEDG